MTIAANYPTIRPTLDLNFAATKELDPRVTFARASTGTYYDGKTTAVAEQNLLTYSQVLTNNPWGVNRATRTANQTAPDDTLTATTITATSGTGELYQPQTLSAGTYTFSIYLKRKTGTGDVQLKINTASNVTIDGTWQRYSITQTVTANGGYYPGILIITSGDEVYAWGAQLEQRSTVTAYTPTTTASITNYIPALQTAAAGVPRFDCNPTTSESLGLLIEEQRTNLILQSQFASGWAATRLTLSTNQIVSPDGTLTGAKIIDDISANSHYIYNTASLTNGVAYTFTFYAKAGGRSWVTLWVTNLGTAGNTYFDLQNGVLGTVGTGVTASITSVGNGWYRCSVTGTSTSTGTTVYIGTATANNTNTAAGDGYSGIYIWGAQLEAGSFATSYIPTVASQVTRSADSASMTGSNFSSWYRADEGTLYGESILPSLAGSFPLIVAVSDGGTSYISLNKGLANSASASNLVLSAGVSQATLTTANAFIASTANKNSIAYKVNDFSSSVNGGVVVTDTSGSVPVVNQLSIGSLSGFSNINGTIKRIAFWPKRLSNTELQALTS